MKPLLDKLLILAAVLLLPFMLISCGGSGDSGTPAATGTLELGLTDAAIGDFQAVYVTVAEVQVKKQDAGEGEAGWETVMAPEKTYDLLELMNGVVATLGVGELQAGPYDQMRLILGDAPEEGGTNILDQTHPYANYFIDDDESSIELKVPSGYQTGVKIVGGFIIYSSQATDLTLDFDVSRSIVQAGKSGKWLLKPTIKTVETMENSVQGEVTTLAEGGGSVPVEGTLVSAQVNMDPQDEVIVEATTVTTDEGMYKLYLPPDLYNIVVTKSGFLPACQEVEAQYYEKLVVDFSLLPDDTENITISGTVTGLTVEEGAAARLSIRQIMDCGSGNVQVEVASVSVAEGGKYSFTLPAGTYKLVASTAGKETKVFATLAITDENLDVNFD